MPKVLIVEDSKALSKLEQKKIDNLPNYNAKVATSFKETKEILENENDFLVAIVDLNLPDSLDGEIVDYILSKKIAVIVLASAYDEQTREKLLNKNIVDYVIKENVRNLEYITYLIQRLFLNQFTTILVVDDSLTYRNHIKKLLINYKFNVLEASNGQEALEIMKNNSNISMVITDYEMPVMDGFKLVSKLREIYNKDELAIIGMSGSPGHGNLSAKFLKVGANDFLLRPFINEEFYCRVNQNIEMLEYFKKIKDSANRDYLTNLFNRRYFFEIGSKFYENAKRGNLEIGVAMIDIDFFKKINDTYGHAAGDVTLKYLAKIFSDNFRATDIISRFGGEEFCILLNGINSEKALDILERIKEFVESSEIIFEENLIKLTVSIGFTTNMYNSLEEMINNADKLLYYAKENGRNKIYAEIK